MGLTPNEFCACSPRDFALMVEGYKSRRLDEYRLNRNLMFVMVRLWSSKPPSSPNQLWDLGDEDGQLEQDEVKKIADIFAKLKANG
jgi:hypothetical protein